MNSAKKLVALPNGNPIQSHFAPERRSAHGLGSFQLYRFRPARAKALRCELTRTPPCRGIAIKRSGSCPFQLRQRGETGESSRLSRVEEETSECSQERPKPTVTAPTDAIVKMTLTTICGTDLHILKGDVATCEPGRILGHEGVGVVEEVGAAVTMFKPGDRVLISCITACGKCDYCRKLMYSHCTNGGWILGNKIDGTQAEFVRIPYAETSLYPIPAGGDEEALVMLSDILPTGFECGVLNGKVQPGVRSLSWARDRSGSQPC